MDYSCGQATERSERHRRAAAARAEQRAIRERTSATRQEPPRLRKERRSATSSASSRVRSASFSELRTSVLASSTASADDVALGDKLFAATLGFVQHFAGTLVGAGDIRLSLPNHPACRPQFLRQTVNSLSEQSVDGRADRAHPLDELLGAAASRCWTVERSLPLRPRGSAGRAQPGCRPAIAQRDQGRAPESAVDLVCGWSVIRHPFFYCGSNQRRHQLVDSSTESRNLFHQ